LEPWKLPQNPKNYQKTWDFGPPLEKSTKKEHKRFKKNLAYNFTSYILDVPLKVGCKLALSQRAVVVVEKTIGQPPLPPSDVVSGPVGTKKQ
jgi:hypothetical protein